MYTELTQEFDGKKVVDFEDASSWQGPSKAYRVRQDYEDEMTATERLRLLLEQTGSEQLSTLIIGAWERACEGESSSEIVGELVAAASRLKSLSALFLGDIVMEESELSWINQTDVSPILKAHPKLQVFRVRGGNQLAFSRVKHPALRDLAIEAGGLPRSVIREIFQCDFPALERLELLLGEPNYGFDGSVEDLQPLLTGKLFPKLRHLGLMNSEISNDIAAVVVNAPILERIETLDLSMGNLDREGVRSLMALKDARNLRTLNISHHYASDAEIKALRKAVPFEVIAEDRQEAEDDDWRGILHAE
jgi:hypothetical protein